MKNRHISQIGVGFKIQFGSFLEIRAGELFCKYGKTKLPPSENDLCHMEVSDVFISVYAVARL